VKKIIIFFVLLLGSTSFAETPQPLKVAKTILADSGFSEAIRVSELQVGSARDGLEVHTRHMLQFHMPPANKANVDGGNYSCDFTYFKPIELKNGNYLVQAQLDNCTNPSGEALNLKNDYTNSRGEAFFQRIFYDNNTQFRPLHDDEKVLARRSGHEMNDDSRVVKIDDKLQLAFPADKAIITDGREGIFLGN